MRDRPPERGRVLEILGPTGQDLRDDQIGPRDERRTSPPDVHGDRPIQKLVFDSRAGEHDVERHRRRVVDERHDPRAPHHRLTGTGSAPGHRGQSTARSRWRRNLHGEAVRLDVPIAISPVVDNQN
jgi:hypothetical protein